MLKLLFGGNTVINQEWEILLVFCCWVVFIGLMRSIIKRYFIKNINRSFSNLIIHYFLITGVDPVYGSMTYSSDLHVCYLPHFMVYPMQHSLIFHIAAIIKTNSFLNNGLSKRHMVRQQHLTKYWRNTLSAFW